MGRIEAPPRPDEATERGPGYDDDFVAWTERQAALIRAGRFDAVDRENVAEEIESLGRSDRRALASRLEVLIAHLLKWQFQPKGRSRSWSGTIRTQRHHLRRLLDESPSLRPAIAGEVDEAYPVAVIAAAAQTRIEEERFPTACPYTADQLLDEDFWPEANATR